MTAPEPEWLIYSHERKAWWRPHRAGYTLDMVEAGRYDEQTAADICWHANRYRSSVEQMPNEVMVPAPPALDRRKLLYEIERHWNAGPDVLLEAVIETVG